MTEVVNLRDYPWSKERKVFVLPDDVVRVDRRTAWGNPFRVGKDGTRAEVIHEYTLWLALRVADEPDYLEPLRGKRLACWCAPLPCHADVIASFLDG
jgi:hypothetical protein